MTAVDVFLCAGLVLCWTPLCELLRVSRGQDPVQDPVQDPAGPGGHHRVSSTETGDGLKVVNAASQPPPAPPAPPASTVAPLHAPCLVDDLITSLREGLGDAGELTNSSLALFGICSSPDNLSSSVLLELVQETGRTQRNGFVDPTGVLVTEDDESGMIQMTFDLPLSPLLKNKPVLLLMLKNPLRGAGDLEVTFRSPSLEPSVQSVCVSGETQYMLLTGKQPQIHIHHKWRISVQTEARQSLRDILIGGKSGNGLSMTPLLLFTGDEETDARAPHVSDSSQTSFLCELKRLLGDFQPRDKPDSPPVQLDSLQSLPPLTIGLSSSETLLAGLINSSAPTVFSFSGWSSSLPRRPGELSLSPALREELRQRLQQTVTQIEDVVREEDIGPRASERLRRLRDLVVFPQKEPATGQNQYRGLVLLKALQAVARSRALQRGLRATRANPSPVSGDVCALRSLTVSLERHVVGPDSANVNNCHGSCRFPLANAINHAVLVDFHIRNAGGERDERAPCCVPLAYEALEVVDFNEHGTYLSIKPDMVAKECGCR